MRCDGDLVFENPTVWFGAVSSKDNHTVRCVSVKNVKNRTAPYLHCTKVLGFNERKAC